MGKEFVQPAHKSGPLKQSNKAHKHGRHRTKGQIDGTNRGKVDAKTVSKRVKKLGRQQRRQQALQMRKSKQADVLHKKRGLGKDYNVPHIIAIVPLSSSCNTDKALEHLAGSDDSIIRLDNERRTVLISTKHRQRFTILRPQCHDLISILDAGKVADTILFILSTDDTITEAAQNFSTCLLAQCLPNTFHAIQGLNAVLDKKKSEVRKLATKSIEKWFPDAKIHNLDSEQEAGLLLRHVANQKQRSVFYRERRPYLLADRMEYIPDSEKEDSVGTLKVTGFVRGRTLDVNRLVHIPGFGDFQMKQIDSPSDPYAINQRKTKPNKNCSEEMTDDNIVCMDEDVKIIAAADANLQTSLDSEAIPDPMDGEQTWPDENEIQEAEDRNSSISTQSRPRKKKIPKGTSDYQAAWIVDSENEDSDAERDSTTDDESFEDEGEHLMENEDESDINDADVEDVDSISVSTNIADDKYDQALDLEEEKRQLEIYRAERENEMFPDEIDTPADIPARVRFQRYRGLKSFRTSPWDPKENLPWDYSRIFQFENFTRTRKRVIHEEDVQGAVPGSYVTVHIMNVPKQVLEKSSQILIIYGLLPHEHKITVMHFVIKRHQSFVEPVKAKERLIFHVGYRRYSNCPIFSQHTTGSKFKSERFLPKEGVTVATLYAPVIFPPAPVLVFTKDHKLVATGTVLKSDPNRIVVKKIVLSGHPFKINKKSVVVRHMFFNRDDILWFKPVELYTKYGRHGHIKEPLGTHGHMKCTFDNQLKAQDTVCLSLYKRIFPKWTYDPLIDQSDSCQENPFDDTDIAMM